jgi:hypothetical protein
MVMTWKANAAIATNVAVTLDSEKLNTATFTTVIPIPTDTSVILTCNGTEVFEGMATSMTQMSDARYDIEITEYAKKLYNEYCFSPAVKGLFMPNIIIHNYDSNTDTKLTIGEYIHAICDDFNHSTITLTPVDEDGINSMTEIPGMGLPLPDVTISHQSIGTTLRKFIVDTLGLSLWYEYISATSFEVHYGTARDTIHLNLATEFIVNNNSSEEAIKIPIIGVYIKNEDDTKHGYAGDYVTGPCIMREIEGSFSENELNAMASVMLAEYALPRLTYDVEFLPGTIRFKECDIFDGIGDQTLDDPFKMTYKTDADPWRIKSVKITDKNTIATLW